MSKKKLMKGPRIESIGDIERYKHFWWNGKCYTSRWILSWQYSYLRGKIQRGELYQAIHVCPYDPEGCIFDDPLCSICQRRRGESVEAVPVDPE